MTLTLYVRPNSSLCEEAEGQLLPICERFGIRLELCDITCDRALLLRYRYDVPVGTCDGVELFRHRVQADALMQALRGMGVAEICAVEKVEKQSP